jgi:hypothetical protein
MQKLLFVLLISGAWLDSHAQSLPQCPEEKPPITWSKSQRLPSIEVLEADGQPCQAFVAKDQTKNPRNGSATQS